MTETFDLVVIGSGAAAQAVASRCRAAGWTVAMVDKRPFGGTCALRGCDPKTINLFTLAMRAGVTADQFKQMLWRSGFAARFATNRNVAGSSRPRPARCRSDMSQIRQLAVSFATPPVLESQKLADCCAASAELLTELLFARFVATGRRQPIWLQECGAPRAIDCDTLIDRCTFASVHDIVCSNPGGLR